MQARIVALVVAGSCGLLLAGAAQGQQPGGIGGRPGGYSGGSPGGSRVEIDPEPLPSPEDLAGPPIPDFVVDRFELDSVQGRQYLAVYDSFMVATRPLRDSAQGAQRAIDVAMQSRNRDAARPEFPLLRRMGSSLRKLDDQFDGRLKSLFTKTQYKDYKEWRSDQRRQAEQDRKDRMQQMGRPGPGT